MSLMPDVAFLTEDPALGAQPFTIIRSNGGKWVQGKFVDSVVSLPAVGNIQPSGAHRIDASPEGDRSGGAIMIHSTTMMQTAKESGNATGDKIVWQGETYKVTSVERWDQFGFNIATAERM